VIEVGAPFPFGISTKGVRDVNVISKRKAVAGTAAVGVGALVAGLALGSTQLALAGHENPVLFAELNGREEVANDAKDRRIVGDPNGRGEIYVFGIDGDPQRTRLCYVLLVDKIANTDLPPGAPRAAHIHQGRRGENGPVVVNLAWPEGGQAADCLSVGDTRGGRPVFPTGVTPRDIFANPEGFYVNVHNDEFPAGAVRGQLVAR
jgi:hypothetical protein